MDNYKNSSTFESLAIKILENYLNVSLDYNKSKITQKTRDYGVDSFVFIENETKNIVRTIEAKLRSNNYTLALKDIATSIIFFILRHGDEHYIITNVFLTGGTKEAIFSINNKNPGKIHYIDGKVTKEILERIVSKLHDDELKLAKYIINDYSNLKVPKNSCEESVKERRKDWHLYESRAKCLRSIVDGLKTKNWISLSGSIGLGKHIISQEVSKEFEMNDYLTIHINALSNNLISNFCCEVTKGLFGAEIGDLVSLVQDDDEYIEPMLNNEERNNLNIIYRIFNTKSITIESSRYLAKQYLLNLFKSFFNNNYLIILDNFDSVSEDLFYLITELSVENNTNFKFLTLTSNNNKTYVNRFSFEFKKLHYKTFKETEIHELKSEESIEHIISCNDSINPDEAKKVYDYIGGNPVLIEEFVKSNNNVLAISSGVFNFSDLYTYYDLEIESYIDNEIFLFLFFLVFTLDGIEKERIACYYPSNKLIGFFNYIEHSPILSFNNSIINFKSKFIKDLVEKYLLKNKKRIRHLIHNYKYQFEFNDSLSQIIYYYFEHNNNIIEVFLKTREYWNHKNNIDWNIKAISYVCLFLSENNVEVNSIMEFCKYANIYTGYYEKTRESISKLITNQLKLHIEQLELSFFNHSEIIKKEIANILFDYYINYSQTLNKSKSACLVFSIEQKPWFTYINEYRKIKYLRLKALGFKAVGNKSEFYNQIKKLLDFNTPYALFSYYANVAAQYYNLKPEKAYELLSNCPFGVYSEIEMQELQLWIENDFSIVLFYLNNYSCSKKSAEIVLQKSKHLSYDENIARSYNIIALNELINNNKEIAKRNLYNAIVYSIHSNNDSLFHFSVNYLNLEYSDEIETVCYNYFKMNEESIKKILNSEQKSRRLLISLIAFIDVLKSNNKVKYYELKNIYSSALSSFEENENDCIINGKYYVLF